MQTTVEERLFFKTRPALWPLYTALRDKLCLAHPDVRVRVSKTQISFYHRRLFAMVSLPRHRFSGISGEFLLVSFGLGSVKQDTRIAEVAQPYPGRVTHHVPVQTLQDLDTCLLGWLDEAYHFSLAKS